MYSYRKNKRKIIKIEIKDSVKIIENRNKINYFVSALTCHDAMASKYSIYTLEFFLSLYHVLVIHYLLIV